MDKTAFIFARGGSKGVHGKNIKKLAGKPLIAWSIEQALSTPEIDRVIVSTDSPEIQAIAVEYGGTVPFIRPSELATDEAPEWLSWQHALNFLLETEGAMPTRMISVPTTSPLRLSNDISSCIKLYDESDFDAIITGTEARRSPHFNMVRANPFGEVELLLTADHSPVRRQDTTQAYDLTTVCYVINSNFVMQSAGIFDGRVGIYSVPQERAVDIDTEFDFQIADFLLRERLTSESKF